MDIAKILDQLSKKISLLSPEETKKLEEGLFDICIRDTKPTKNKPTNAKLELSEVIGRLHDSKTRDESYKILEDASFTVAELNSLSKALEIAYKKGEKKEYLIDRIVEKTVGFKLNSEAVRGL